MSMDSSPPDGVPETSRAKLLTVLLTLIDLRDPGSRKRFHGC